jgi:asparagine synthase (glutamine-hydrolysing)
MEGKGVYPPYTPHNFNLTMCGILGCIGPGTRPEEKTFVASLDTIAHRGPDDHGVFVDDNVLLGHRRLSILDLSPAGHQPMVDPESGAVIVFNGEIYNYLELRAELTQRGCRFRSQTDTEVLLKAYLEWGPDALKRMNGMWAFAIWLPRQRKLFFARDRFGVKPLYYLHADGFTFASEPKAILSLRPEQRAVNVKTLYEFLALGHLYSSHASFYKDIALVPPAHCGEYDLERNSLRLWQYWDYPDKPAEDLNPDQAAEQFDALFTDAVRLRLRSDVPVGVSLSGGLDSSAILATIAGKLGSRPVCFTSVFGEKEPSESDWAQTAAAPYAISPVEVSAPFHEWLDTLQAITWHMDQPGRAPAVYPLWHLMKEARRRGVPVLLEGQGADEALGGYTEYGAIKLLGLLYGAISKPTIARWEHLLHFRRRLSATFGNKWLLLWVMRESMPYLSSVYRGGMGVGRNLIRKDMEQRALTLGARAPLPPSSLHLDHMNTRLRFDHAQAILPGLLQYGDAMSMAHGIEARQPFLDYRLVEWMFTCASAIKYHDGWSKWPLRAYLQHHGQKRIAERVDKKGYPTPTSTWLARDRGAVLREFLLSSDSLLLEYCDKKSVKTLVDRHADSGGVSTGYHVYQLFSTELWLRSCTRKSTGCHEPGLL